MISRSLRIAVRSSVVAVIFALVPATASAQVIDFEALDAGLMPQGYFGMNWLGGFGASSWVVADPSSGFDISQPVSGTKNAWSNGGIDLSMATIDGSEFDFAGSFMACANGWCATNPSVSQTVRGFRDGFQIFESEVTVTRTMQFFAFDFLDVDEVRWDIASPTDVNLLIDDIQLNATVVPEPSSLLMLLAGVSGLGLVARRRALRGR